MIGLLDWQDALDELSAAERRVLGAPPTAEEVLAYMAGELSERDEARVRKLLVAYPEMAFAAVAEIPEEPEPMRREELDRHWAAFRSRFVQKRQGRVIHFWRTSAALAAAMALMFGVLLWRAQAKLQQPRAVQQVVLLEMDGHRGATPPNTIEPKGDATLLAIPVNDAADESRYRVELTRDGLLLWRSGVLRGDAGTFSIVVPSTLLEPGRYQVVLYAVDGGKPQERLVSYTLRVPGE